MQNDIRSPTITPSNEIATSGTEDIAKLMAATDSSLKLLTQWQSKVDFDNKRSSSTVIVVSQARSYVRAINLSIEAAQHGFTFAEEGIDVAKNHQQQERSGEGNTPDDEATLKQYVGDMLEIAKKAKRNSEEALNDFRSVRVALNSLLETARSNVERSRKTNKSKTYSEIASDAFPVLDQFEGCLNSYITWWSRITMEETRQESNIAALKTFYAELREQSAVKKWQGLRDEYTDYKNQIDKLKDQYRSVFNVADEPERQDKCCVVM